MVRMCPGAGLPNAAAKGLVGKYFLLRTKGTQGHEVYDVTNPANPILVSTPIDGQTDTHKNWWECDTGIAYLVGAAPGWRTGRMTQVFGCSDPYHPVFNSNFESALAAAGSNRPCSRNPIARTVPAWRPCLFRLWNCV